MESSELYMVLLACLFKFFSHKILKQTTIKKIIFYISINLDKKAKIYLAQHQKNKSLSAEQSYQLEMFSFRSEKLATKQKTCRQSQYFEKEDRKFIFQSFHNHCIDNSN